MAEKKKLRQWEVEEGDPRKVHAASLAHLPTEWRGKRNRRWAAASIQNESADAECKERLQ